MRVRTHIALLVAGLGGLLALTASVGVSTYRRSLDPDSSSLRDLEGAAEEAGVVALAFQDQVREWRDTLLCGELDTDLEEHWLRFEDEEARVQAGLTSLLPHLGDEPDLHVRTTAVRAEHERLGHTYREAVESFRATEERDPRATAARVHAADRAAKTQLDALLTDLRERIRQRRMEASARGAPLRTTIITIQTAVAILVLLTLLVALDRLVSRPLSIARRSAETIARGELDDPVPLCGLGETRSLLTALDGMRRDLHEAANDLREARDQALGSSRAKATFLANMSHEIRTPMNGVVGMLQLLRDKPLDPEGQEFLDVAAASADDLLRLLDDILDVSKIESGRLELEKVAFEPGPCVEDVTQLLSPAASKKGVELVCLVHSGVPTRVRGDSARLRQVISNLLSNAIKFTGPHGSVLVALLAEPVGKGGVLLRCEVRDTGIGMSAEEISRLFQPFQQADASTTRRFGGTGLGLSICHSLVEMMGGEIGVRSQPGHGSTFYFTVPVPIVDEAPNIERPLAELVGRRALVADDNGANRRMLRYQLSRWGMQVTIVRNGDEAEAAVRRAAAENAPPFDVLLLDYEMPKRDGLDVARSLVADSARRQARIVLLASVRERAELSTAEELGIDAYLTKPIRFQQLEDCLRMVLGPKPSAPQPVLTEAVLMESRVHARYRVLLVEDVEVNRRVATGMLQRLGCLVDAAKDGQTGVEAWEKKRYDIVFMDCFMPGVDGLEATAMIRRIEEERSLPPTIIVALTANAMASDRDACLAAGMNDYLSKPVRADQLKRILTTWLPAAPLPLPSGTARVPARSRSATEPTKHRED